MTKLLEISNKSIFDSECQVIVNPVNCEGFMGKGIALDYKLRYPDMYDVYKKICEEKKLRPGLLHLYRKSLPWILNFPTKDKWRYPSKLEYISSGLIKLCETHKEKAITSIAFPRIGTANGGLDWNDVYKLFIKYLTPLDLERVEIYHYNPEVSDKMFISLSERIVFIGQNYKELGLNKEQADTIVSAISDGTIRSMSEISTLPKIHLKTLEKIYHFVNSADIENSKLSGGLF